LPRTLAATIFISFTTVRPLDFSGDDFFADLRQISTTPRAPPACRDAEFSNPRQTLPEFLPATGARTFDRMMPSSERPLQDDGLINRVLSSVRCASRDVAMLPQGFTCA